MMSSCAGNGKDGKDLRLSSPNCYALHSKGSLPQPQKRRGPRCKYPHRRIPPGIAPASDYEDRDQDPENIPIPEDPDQKELSQELSERRRGPRCKYPRHRFPPGIAPAYDYIDHDKDQDPENIPILEDPDQIEMSEAFAKAALSYLSQQGHNFKLLSVDYYEGGSVGGGARFHHNFQAKPADGLDAPPETFFSQLFFRRDDDLCILTNLTVEYCVSLGPSDSLPKKRDKRGCRFCSIYIHHPKDGWKGIIC